MGVRLFSRLVTRQIYPSSLVALATVSILIWVPADLAVKAIAVRTMPKAVCRALQDFTILTMQIVQG